MLSYEAFLEEVKKHLLEYCPKSYQDRKVLVTQSFKENQVLDGLVLSPEEKTAVPMVYLNFYYQEMCDKNLDMNMILKILSVEYQKAEKSVATWPVPNLESKEWILKNLFTQALNYKQNYELLQTVPHLRVNDLAIIPRVNVGQNATMKMTYEHCERCGLEGDLVVAMAIRNNTKLSKPSFTSMDELMPDFYVLTNESGYGGASLIADKQVLDAVAKTIGGKFYILPSSIHELIIVPDHGQGDPKMMREVVMMVNRDTLEPEQFLSDNVYLYHDGKHELQMYSQEQGTMEPEKVEVTDKKDRKRPDGVQRKPKSR